MEKFVIVKEYNDYFLMNDNLFTGKLQDKSQYMENYDKRYKSNYDNQKTGPRSNLKKKYLYFILKCIPSDCNKILDMCCGTGDFVELLSKKGYDVEGVDYNKDAIEKARKNYINNKYSQGDIREWKPKEKKDLIIIMDAFYEFKKELRTEIFNRLKEFLNPGGYFLITIPCSKRYIKPSKESPVPKYNADIKNELTHMMFLDTYIEWSSIDWENHEDMNKGIVILKNI